MLRPILGGADFSLLLYGATGVFKTELATLLQQHFGADFDSRHPPTSFTSTANTNELLAFIAKDAVLLVDELHPPATGRESETMHRDAGRLLRSQGNNTGRGRMRPDGTLRPPSRRADCSSPLPKSCLVGKAFTLGSSLAKFGMVTFLGKSSPPVSRTRRQGCMLGP